MNKGGKQFKRAIHLNISLSKYCQYDKHNPYPPYDELSN